jgi:ADP-heptose:LPS heptosyltransferase
LAARLQIVKTIRQRKFHTVINLHGGPTSAQLTFLSGAQHRVGAQHFRNGYAYNRALSLRLKSLLRRTDLHTVEYQFRPIQLARLATGGTRANDTVALLIRRSRSLTNSVALLAGIEPTQALRRACADQRVLYQTLAPRAATPHR